MVARSTTTPEPLLIDSRDAARLLCVSESTLARLVRASGLPSVQIGRSVRFDPVDLRAWIEARKNRQE